MTKKNLIKQLKSYFYMLNNNFSYTQLASAFVPQEDSYYVHDDTDAFFLLHLLKNFHIFLGPFFFFVFFRMLLLGAFLCVFNNSYLPFLYIEKIFY